MADKDKYWIINLSKLEKEIIKRTKNLEENWKDDTIVRTHRNESFLKC